jgi:hypothetical protein
MEPKVARQLPFFALAGPAADSKVGAGISSLFHLYSLFGWNVAAGASIPVRMLQSHAERKRGLDAGGDFVRAVPGKSNTGGSTDVR